METYGDLSQYLALFQADPPNKAGRKYRGDVVGGARSPVGVSSRPTQQGRPEVVLGAYEGAKKIGVSSRPTQQGRPEDGIDEDCDSHDLAVFQADPPNKAGRKEVMTFEVTTKNEGSVSSRPTQQGRPEVVGCDLQLDPGPASVSSRPTQQGRPEVDRGVLYDSSRELRVSSRPTQQGRPEVAFL